MPHYWVFWDENVGRIRIHRAECRACKYGTGIYSVKITEGPQDAYDWEPANSHMRKPVRLWPPSNIVSRPSISRPQRIATYVIPATVR
jgi:hypothetical protein